MFPAKCCFCFARSTLFLNIDKARMSKRVPFRLFFKWGSLKPKPSKQVKIEEENKLKPLTGFDDPNFSKHLWHNLRHFDIRKQKEGLKRFLSECRKLATDDNTHEEPIKENADGRFRILRLYHEIPDERIKIKILHKFETPKDLEGYSVVTDSSLLKGFSSASFKLTENETAVFSGNICTDLPKSGEVRMAGYANLQFPKKRKIFNRHECYDWQGFNNLVLKIRGDGRTYMVILNIPSEFEEDKSPQHVSPLFTRGGPYWQIVKIPFSHFYFTRKGRIYDKQDGIIASCSIVNMSITVGGYDGPFKLELDYVGLERKDNQKVISPYEQYK